MKTLDQLQRYILEKISDTNFDGEDCHVLTMAEDQSVEYVKLSDVEELLEELLPGPVPPLTTAQYRAIADAMPIASKFQQAQSFTPIPPEKVEWVLVGERLPGVRENVTVSYLMLGKPFVDVAFLNEDGAFERCGYESVLINSKVTHWQPLPKPPEFE